MLDYIIISESETLAYISKWKVSMTTFSQSFLVFPKRREALEPRINSLDMACGLLAKNSVSFLGVTLYHVAVFAVAPGTVHLPARGNSRRLAECDRSHGDCCCIHINVWSSVAVLVVLRQTA